MKNRWKKIWILVPTAIAVLAISIVTAGATLAQQNETTDSPVAGKFASRVATILGLDETQVQDAMDQARQELKAEAIQSRLDSLVEEGRITQEQADEYREWFESRPDGFRGFGKFGRGSGQRRSGPGGRSFQGIPDRPPSDSSFGVDPTTLY